MTQKNALSDMIIDEISLVDDGANQHARVVIVKAKSGLPDAGSVDDRVAQAMEYIKPRIAQALASREATSTDAAATAALKEFNMDLETLSKALEEAEESLQVLAKRADDAEAAVVEAQAVIKARDEQIAALTVEKSSATPSDEDVLKSLPESIRKRITESEETAAAALAEVAKVREEAETNEAISKAKTFGVGDATVIGPLLMRVRKGKTTEDDAAKIEQLLKSAAAVNGAGRLFESLGSSPKTEADAEAILKAKALELQAATPGLTYEQAYVRAMDQNAEVYEEYVGKSNRRVHAA